MKRNINTNEAEATGKRPRSSLAFYGAGVTSCKSLSHSDAWHSAKQLVADDLVSVKAVYHDADQHDGAVHVVCDISAFNTSTASFPHLLEPYACGVISTSPAPQLAAAAHITIDSNTGEVLDANSSCCPGGFQPVLGSLCPCVLAALLTAAKHAAQPSESQTSQQVDPSAWAGSTLSDAHAAAHQDQKQQQNHQQRNSLQQSLCLVQKQAFSVLGLGLSVWDCEQQLSSVAKVHFASHRGGDGLYGGYYGGRASHDADLLSAVEDAESDLSNHQWYSNTVSDNLAVPVGFFENSNVAAWPPTKETDPTVVEAAAEEEHRICCRQLLAHVSHVGLTQYGSSTLLGSSRNRPKVINQAFERLTGGTNADPPQPVSAVVLILRALWEYLHIHGLGRLLAKPLKMLLALRNILLVSSVPLWLRKSVCCQLDIWEKGLLYQHAGSPLSVDGNVGIVHLLRVLQEARQLCLHHWDSPQLAKLLIRATSADHQQHHDPQSEVIVWQQELPSLLQLRLKMLGIVRQHNAYLELAMAGGAWREAISNMLRSKERSQLLRAVSLLPLHISSLSERMSYMTQLLELQSLGAPEKLEVAARLLLAVREQLEAHVVDVCVANPSRHSSGPRDSSMYTRYIWKVSQYVVPKAISGPGRKYDSAGDLQNQANIQLQAQWDIFLTLFVRTAAEALFDAGKESKRSYNEYVKAECGQEQDEAGQQPRKQQDQQQFAGPSAAPAAGTSAAAAAAAGVNGTSAAIESIRSTPAVRHDACGDMQHQFSDFMRLTMGIPAPKLPPGVLAEPTYELCSSCGEYHRVHPGPMRVTAAAQAAAVAAAAGQANPQLLAIDDRLFTSSGQVPTSGYPPEAEAGSLQSRSTTGYILDQKVVQAYRKVVAVEYPELLPLCSLDALCVARLSSAVMQHFDSNGVLDTSLPLDPLKDLLSHGLVEAGPGPVRVQAALEVAVYATIMTPLQPTDSTTGDLYRRLTYMLLGSGQRRLALMAARTRFKVVPSTHAAAELMEVAIACGLEDESAAVDLILGKSLVRDADDVDEIIQAGPAAGRPIEDHQHLHGQSAMERSLRDFQRELMYFEADHLYGDHERFLQQLAGAANLPYPRRHLPGGRLPPPMAMDDSDYSLSDSEQWYSQGSDGDEERIDFLDDDSPGEAADTPERRQQEVQRAAAEAAAAAAAAGENPAAAALEAARAAQQQHGAGAISAADKGTSTDVDSSLNTCDLLGDAAKAIQLQDTASSSKRAAAAESAAIVGPAAAAAAAPPLAPQAAAARHHYVDYDDDSDVDADDYGMEHEYRRTRPVRDVPAAQLQARPVRAAAGSRKKRKHSTSPAPAAAAAPAGGGSGPPGGGDDDGPGSGRLRSSADNKKRRRSPNHSKNQFADSQQADLVSDLFGITESSHARPGSAYRIHLRRLSGLQLWPVVKYAAGRGAATDNIRKLGLAAWLSDSTYGHPRQTSRSQLQWQPVSVSQQTWLDTVESDRQYNPTSLPAVSTAPYGGTSVEGHSWSGLPSSNWDSFVSPSRYIGSLQHHDTPDAHLAWLIATISAANTGAGGAPSATGDAKVQRPVFYIAPKPLTGIPDYTWRSQGTYGAGLYRNKEVAASAADSDTPGVDLSAAAELLEQLASLSKGVRYGLPVLQLCHALLSAGNRSACLSLLPQGLLPAAANLPELTTNTCITKALHEIMPAVAKHGDVNLQVNAIITELILTRDKVPAAMIREKEVLSGVLSWWLGLVCALHKKPAEWSPDKLAALNPGIPPEHYMVPGRDQLQINWLHLQQLLVKCIMPSLVGSQTDQAAASGSSEIGGAVAGDLLSGWQLLLGCDAVIKAHWAFKLYLVRVCYKVGLCSDLSTASPLLIPALSAAAQEHLSGIVNDKTPIKSISEWKGKRQQRVLSSAANRALAWVQATLTWITEELKSSEAASPAVGSDKQPLDSHQLSEFVDDLHAAVLGVGWHGPELLPLATTLHKLTVRRPQLQRELTVSLLGFLEVSLIPLAGRADELSDSKCVRCGTYTEVIRSIMSDQHLLDLLPRDVARNLALTFWHQEGTFAALLKANDLLIKLEGAPSACQVTVPSGTGLLPSGPSNVSGSAGRTPDEITPSSDAIASTTQAAPSITGLPGLSALHPVLLENLDLVPSRGEEMQAAGLRFMQLQRHAGTGNYEAALESIFSIAPENGSPSGPAAGSSSGSGRLDNAMKVADDVLRLLQENSSIPCIGQLISSAPYAAFQSLLSVPIGHGDSILAGLSDNLKRHILRLLIWRISRAIIHVAPGAGQRISSGPQFPRISHGCLAYTQTNALSPPTYNSIEVLNRWALLDVPLTTLITWCSDHMPGLMQPSVVGGAHPASVNTLCTALQLEEESLLWCVTRYARVVAGVQLEQDLCSLIRLEDRTLLGHLPVFMLGLGQEVRSDRGLMWAYCNFKNVEVDNKVSRYIGRSALNQDSLAKYIAKSTVTEIQCMKATSLPWANWEMGQKARQAAELAEWLWWWSATWPRIRRDAGVASYQLPLPAGTLIRHPM